MLVAKHLRRNEKIKLGAFYTPEFIAQKVKELVSPFLSADAVVLDPAGGCGAFIKHFQDFNYRVADIDSVAVEYLKRNYPPEKVFYADALSNIRRDKYNISNNDFLIIVGNPPYNDWTSLYKKGHKGQFDMDRDVFDRDLGIAFLKAMNKLKADIICILHPMSYLTKKANFNRLSEFFHNYELIEAYIFPSFVFHGTSKTVGFPVLVALYKRSTKGWTWKELLDFEFKFLFSEISSKLKEIQTTDGMISKYPKKGISSLGLYFHTFRDINSLLRNRDFLLSPTNLTIPIEWENLTDYAYLVALKHYIKERGVKKFWFYGNFSPLIDKEFYTKHKNYFLHYALEKTKVLPQELKEKIRRKFPVITEFSEIVERYFAKLFKYATSFN
ncbi:MAG: Eco57I restriction-modification methylase domain-containing protein [Thermodesulfovibrio sp.]|nr:Eco57I restriction-modification methylase domain-containing protein [Thermodesulfovibrio sp.]